MIRIERLKTMGKPKIDVIIPLYCPDHKLEQLIRMLLKQSILPNRIILMNTECFPEFATLYVKERMEALCSKIRILRTGTIDIKVYSVLREEFDHGGTRALAASYSDADYMIYMTQDAIPKHTEMIRQLIEPFHDQEVAVVYGRQEASMDSSMVEQYSRLFNYPATDKVKTKEDLKRLGIKTYFCSNVCAAYRKTVYDKLGGFVKKTIFNEDMIFAATAIQHDYKIYYASKAVVLHSHHYDFMQQARRNFDLGVSHYEYRDIFECVSSEKEGIRYVKQLLSYLKDQREYLEMIDFLIESGFKYIGYFLGKHYTWLPQSFCKRLSMNQAYWR